MKVTHHPHVRLAAITAALSVGFMACSGGDIAPGTADAGPSTATPSTDPAAAPAVVEAGPSAPAVSTDATAAPAATGASLADGPDVCFRAIARHLGADVKVSEITSFFTSGSDGEPQGKMTSCTVQYQSPDDPRKLVGTRMNVDTGAFSAPQPIEITVMGNAADFRLEDYLIPLSQVDAAALTSIMDAQKATLEGVYSKYGWSGVRLMAPGAFSDKHTLRLDVEGRLAANDIKENGYASVSVDGKAITTNHLLP